MKPIFNEKVVEKCNLWVCEQCTKALFTEYLVNNCGLKKKKKKKRRKKKRGRANAQSKHILSQFMETQRFTHVTIVFSILYYIKGTPYHGLHSETLLIATPT